MKRAFVVSLVLATFSCVTAGATAPEQDNHADPVRFIAIDVYLDSSEPVAAWQFEMGESDGRMTVVGVENGSSQAFSEAPYFDREAVQLGNADRIIVADYSLEPADKLPTGRTRLATIHLRISGGDEPELQLNLVAAASASGKRLNASISMERTIGRQE